MTLRNVPDRATIYGRPVIQNLDGIPGYQWDGLFDVHGRYGTLSVEEEALWQGQNVSASFRVPLRTNVHPGDRMLVAGEKWEVVSVRPNRGHLRCLLRR